MSKNKGNGDFPNKAAKKFKQLDKVDLMTQQEIFEIFDEEIGTILGQYTAHREHRGRYPQYVSNAFANLSTALWVYNYVDEHIKIKKHGKIKTDLSEDELESLRTMIADAYKKSATNQYPQQIQEFKERNELLSKAFIKLSPTVYKLTKQLNVKSKVKKSLSDTGNKKQLSKSQRRDLTIQIYGDPVNNMRFVHKIFNHSSLSDKKKLKLMKEMYGKERFIDAVGAAMTVDNNNSDCLAMLYDHLMNSKKKKRAKYILAYAKAYKKNKTSNFRLQGGEFYTKNKKMIKELEDRWDIGFKKAFKNLKPKGDQKRTEKK